MILVVGLGNPGRRYRNTPHNLGFRVCERIAELGSFDAEVEKFEARFLRGRIDGKDTGLLMPQTYMNLSGESVARAMRYLPVTLDDLIVVFDDMDLPLGRLRVRPGGGAGGHNGVRSLIQSLGTQSFARVRVGVGRPSDGRSPTGHLLGRISEEDRPRFEAAVARAADAARCIWNHGVAEAMNRFNAEPGDDSTEGTS
ncbi:MAG: aminoacyl-tRNA hydrolase [Myxococcota bacterium]